MKTCLTILLCLITLCVTADRRGQLMQQHPASGGFNFNSINGLALWLEPRSTKSVNSPIQNGDTITNITDLSSSNATVSVNSAPIYISSGGGSNNVPYIVLTNGSFFKGVQHITGVSNRFTCIMVLNLYRAGSGNPIMFGGSGSQPNANYNYTGNYTIYNGNSISGGPVITNRWHVLTVNFDGSSSLVRTNGATVFSGNAGLNFPFGGQDDWGVGGIDVAGNYINGAMLRMLIWARVLSSAEYQQVETQCNTDFGLYAP